MTLSQFPQIRSGAVRASVPHLHTGIEVCPTCDQPIPHDRFEEIKERIKARQAAYTAEIAARLGEDFKHEKAEALEEAGRTADANLVAQVARARAEERQAVEADANQRFADAERTHSNAQAALQAQIEQAEVARTTAEKSSTTLRAQLDQAERDHKIAIQSVRDEAESNAVTIRQDALKQAEAAMEERTSRMVRIHQESESAWEARVTEVRGEADTIRQANANLLTQIDQMRIDEAEAIEKARRDTETQVSAARQEATAAAEAAMQEQVAGAERAKAEADARAGAADRRVQELGEQHEADVAQRLKEQREVLEKAQTDAVNAEKSASFQKELKLQSKMDELQRALDNKTAEELGEGAEIDLHEVLKGDFQDDRIERINRGQSGADILHTVMHNGRECGRIIYDSKNHNAWRNDFVNKLASDRIAAKAEHAVLSTRKFPAGKRHLHVQDGVILAAPSRVLALVQILRQHIIQTHTLRLSDEARTQKTAALYAFINSERCRDLFRRIDSQAEKLLDLQVKEKKAHETTWKTQGELIRSVQKVQAEICGEIDDIVGASDGSDTLEHAAHE